MLNENLPASELQQALEEYSNSIDVVMSEITGSTRSIIQNKKLMGKLHHALNISKYSSLEFRKNLLRYARQDSFLQFCDAVKLQHSSDPLPNEYNKLLDQASSLPWGENNETRSFVEIFEYEESLIPTNIKPQKSISMIKKSEIPFKQLKDYQSEIFFKSADKVDIPWSRFIIRMPTGGGKTRVAMEILADFLNNGLQNKEKRQIVWIADRDELCEQAINAMDEIWSHMGKEDIPLYRLWGSNHIDHFEDLSFIVATYQKLTSIRNKNQCLPKPHLIISDEAHNVIAPTHVKVLESLIENQTRIIGLTATPIRGTDTNENQKLLKYFNDEIVEIESGDDNTIEYLQRKGYLSRHIPETIPSNREFNMTPDQRKDYEEQRDLPKGFLDKIANDNKRNIIIAEYLKKLHDDNAQVLYFAPSVKQSKFMCAILLALGASAAHIDGSTPSEYRRDVVAKFREGKINFIFNYNVFATGFDAPNIDAVFIARPTKSIILHQQMIGRGMRGPKMGGTKSFKLYRVQDILPTIELADDYFKYIWGAKNTDS